MSKFIQRLNDISRIAPQPMGFRNAGGVAPRYKIQLIARVTVEDLGQVREALAEADAVLLDVPAGLDRDNIHNVGASIGQHIWGFYSGTAARALWAESEADFVVLSPESALKTSETDIQMGRVMGVAPSLPEGMLRSLNRLPIDAVLIEEETAVAPLSWRILMQVQRTADFLVKPLLTAIPLNISQLELKALWEAGVDGVIVLLTRETTEQFAALRHLIDDGNFSAQRRRGKVEALLPYTSGETHTITADEEDDEEDG
jgi:hypothetical protein